MQEEKLLAEVKSWAGKLPVPEVDILIVDEIGKNISGAGMDTKVINRSVNGDYNPWPNTPIVNRLYARALSDLTYHSAVGLGMADLVHDRLIQDVDWKPTYINSLTAGTPAAIRTPIHFPSDREALEAIAPTVGKLDMSTVTYCRIKNTLELAHVIVSENLIDQLAPGTRLLGEPFELEFDANGDILDHQANKSRTEEPTTRIYFQVVDVQQKLRILADAAKYDASCASSGSKRARVAGGLGNNYRCRYLS